MAHLQLCLYELLSWCLNCGNAFIRPTEQRNSIAAQLPVDTNWGDVSGGKRSLYLSVKKARGERACTTRRRRALSRTGCLEDHRAACLTLGEQGRFSVQIKEA